jgi:hypothetical protein
MISDNILTAKEVAAEFGDFFTENRLRLWRWRGGGPRYSKLGRRCVYRRADVSAWIEANSRSRTGGLKR